MYSKTKNIGSIKKESIKNTLVYNARIETCLPCSLLNFDKIGDKHIMFMLCLFWIFGMIDDYWHDM